MANPRSKRVTRDAKAAYARNPHVNGFNGVLKGAANPKSHPRKRSHIPADLLALGDYGHDVYVTEIVPEQAKNS